jgi:hypothetical protein
MFKKIALFFRKLTGTKPCRNILELTKYIKPGDVYGLQHWVMQCVWYKSDVNQADEWEDPDTVLKREPPTSDCEEKAAIPYTVIKTWKDWKPMILCVYPREGAGHAVCVFERPDMVKGYMDDSGVHLFERMYWHEIARRIAPWVDTARWADVKGRTIGKVEL